MKIYTAIALGMYLYGWYKRASKDGEITQKEMAEAFEEALLILALK
jgi:uncharacterized protein YodC (DUF2158 family)